MPIPSARRMIQIRLVGVGQTLANASSNAVVEIPAGANAFYYGGDCRIVFDGNASSSTTGMPMVFGISGGVPIQIPQGSPNLNIYGASVNTYIQFCQVTSS